MSTERLTDETLRNLWRDLSRRKGRDSYLLRTHALALIDEVFASRSSPGSGDEGRALVREMAARPCINSLTGGKTCAESDAWVRDFERRNGRPAEGKVYPDCDPCRARRALSSPVSVPAPGDGALRGALERAADTFHVIANEGRSRAFTAGFTMTEEEVRSCLRTNIRIARHGKAAALAALRRALDASPGAPGTNSSKETT